MKKHTLLLVGIVGAVVILFLYSKSKASSAANAPLNAGTSYAGSSGSDALNLGLGAASGILSNLTSGFGGDTGDGSNDPGLYDSSDYSDD